MCKKSLAALFATLFAILLYTIAVCVSHTTLQSARAAIAPAPACTAAVESCEWAAAFPAYGNDFEHALYACVQRMAACVDEMPSDEAIVAYVELDRAAGEYAAAVHDGEIVTDGEDDEDDEDDEPVGAPLLGMAGAAAVRRRKKSDVEAEAEVDPLASLIAAVVKKTAPAPVKTATTAPAPSVPEKKDLSALTATDALQVVVDDLYAGKKRGSAMKIRFIMYYARLLKAKESFDACVARQAAQREKLATYRGTHPELDDEQWECVLRESDAQIAAAAGVATPAATVQTILHAVGAVRLYETEPQNERTRIQNFARNFNNISSIKCANHTDFETALSECKRAVVMYHICDYYTLPTALSDLATEPEPVGGKHDASFVPLERIKI